MFLTENILDFEGNQHSKLSLLIVIIHENYEALLVLNIP